MQLILHCGTAKTGTTSLQACLHKSRHILAEQGVLYPDPMFGLNSHLGLIPRFKGRGRLSKRIAQAFGSEAEAVAGGRSFFDALCAEAKETKPEVVVLSCEYLFQSLGPAQLRKMVEALASLGSSVLPVVYVREPASWYASSCQQDTKMGRPLKRPEAQVIRKPLEVLEAVFGPVMVRKFARDSLEAGDIVTDFVTHVLRRPDLLPGLEREERNASISAEACAIVEFYRTHFASNRIGLAHVGTRKLISRIAALEAAGQGAASPVLRPEIARLVRRASVDYAWLRERHGIAFAEYELANAAGTGSDDTAAGGKTVPRIETVFELDTLRRDRIIAQLLNDVVDPVRVAGRKRPAKKLPGRGGLAGRRGKARRDAPATN